MCLIHVVDRMAVVQELMAVKQFKNCKALSDAYVSLIHAKAHCYQIVRVVFDNYSVEGSLKETTRERRRVGKKVHMRSYKAEDATQIRDAKAFLRSNATKDSLTLYLAQKLVTYSKTHIITATRKYVMSNKPGTINPGVSSQEEADTLMILHACEAAKAGCTVHIYSQDTDVLVLALKRVPQLGKNVAMVMGTGDRRRLIMLEPIYNALGSEKATGLCKWHALTGCDKTGHMNGKSKKACLKAYLKASPEKVSLLGICDEPSADTITAYASFLCSQFCRKGINISKPHNLRWKLFKQQGHDKGVDLLPPTFGAWKEHIHVLGAHCQAAVCLLWEQDLILQPTMLDPLKLGWIKEDRGLVPMLSKVSPAPQSVVELVHCNCGTSSPTYTNNCATGRCSCKSKNLVCTELCRCEAEEERCENSASPPDAVTLNK